MNVRANVLLAALFIGALALGARQGARVDELNTADRFHSWVISACTQVAQSGSLESAVSRVSSTTDEEPPDYKDTELFNQTADLFEPLLPPVEAEEGEEDLRPLVQFATAVSSDEQQIRSRRLWEICKSPEAAPLRQAFDRYLRDGRLASVGTQFSIEASYEQADTMVSLSNLFLGFRQMAANLLWLEADKMWHRGEYYRMIPVMRTTVALDPKFVDAYLIGAWHLAYNATADLQDTPIELRRYEPRFGVRVGDKEAFYYEGVEFLKDGIQKNPTDYRLYFDLGFSIYGEKLEDWENSVHYLTWAHRQEHDVWVPRMLYRAMLRNGQYAQAKAGYEAYLAEHPDNENAARFIKYCDALMAEERADAALERVKAAKAAAAEARAEAERLRAAGDEANAAAREAEAAEHDAEAAEAEAERAQHVAEARRVWESVLETQSDPYAEGKLIELEVDEYIQQERYQEAYALLDYARFQSNELWQDFTDLMIDIRLMEGRSLNKTERDALARRHVAEAVADRTFGPRRFQFRDDGWYQREYRNQALTRIERGSPLYAELAAEIPELEGILALARLSEQYADLEGILDLGDTVVFEANGVWYQYEES